MNTDSGTKILLGRWSDTARRALTGRQLEVLNIVGIACGA